MDAITDEDAENKERFIDTSGDICTQPSFVWACMPSVSWC